MRSTGKGTLASRSAIAVATLLALLCFYRTLSTSLQAPLGPNEEGGITAAVDTSYGAMILGTALKDQINPSPLHYLIDKTWISLLGNWSGEVNLRVFLRIPAQIYFALFVAIFTILAYRWTSLVPVPAPLRLAFAASAGLLVQTNYWTFHEVAFLDRPYALWFLLTGLQLLFLDNALRRERPFFSLPLAIVGALLSLNSFAAASQALAVFAARCRPRSGRPALKAAALEALPALVVGGYYFLHRNYQYLEEYKNYSEFWANALLAGFLLPGVNHFEASRAFGEWKLGGAKAIAYALPFFLLPLLARARPLAQNYLYALSLSLLAIPVTAGALWFGGYLAPRYFFFLFPAFALLQLLSALGLAVAAAKWQRWMSAALVGAWAAMILFFRAPLLLEEFRGFASPAAASAYFLRPAAGCPARFEEVRSPPVNLIDTARFRELCGAQPRWP